MDCYNKESVKRVQQLIRQCTQFLNQYRWIIDAYVSDFFTHDHWDRLPTIWRDHLSQMEPPDLVFLLQRNSANFRKVLPLSLLAYRCCCNSLSFPRDKIDFTNSDFQELFQPKIAGRKDCTEYEKELKSDVCCTLLSEGTTQKSGQCLHLNDSQTYYGAHRKLEESIVSGDVFKCRPEQNNPQSDHDISNTGFRFQPHSEISEGQGQATSQIIHGQYLPLQHCFRKHVKPKKQHEILQLGQVIHMLGQACKCSHVVDIGAGQGHLSRILNFGFGFKVTTVEAAGCHAPKAQKFDKDIKKDIDRSRLKLKRKLVDNTEKSATKEPSMDKGDNISLPDHVTCLIQPDTSVENFLQVVQSSFKKNVHNLDGNSSEEIDDGSNLVNHSQKFDNSDLNFETHFHEKSSFKGDMSKNTSGDSTSRNTYGDSTTKNTSGDSTTKNSVKFMLTGLHACGDLTPTILRVYSKCPDIIGLASVSCCYMKLTCDRSENFQDCTGYPMSKYLHQLPDHHLSYEAREMACHFADLYSKRLKDNPPNLKLHCYRAALQYIVAKLNPDFQRGCIKLTVKNAETMEFKKYATIGLQRLGIQTEMPSTLLQEAESCLPLWKNVVIFYTIRLSLAPVIETLILLDRMLFLYEQGFASSLVPIFDPDLSPRNFVLLSRKN